MRTRDQRWTLQSAVAWLVRGCVLGAVAATAAVLTGWPPYPQLEPGQAVIKLSVRHTGALLGECRALTEQELARLPANMRAPLDCPRERSPIELEMDMDGHRLVDVRLAPQGLHNDGRAVFYQRFVVAAGEHHIELRMKDDERQATFRYRSNRRLALTPGQALIIDFDDRSESFLFI